MNALSTDAHPQTGRSGGADRSGGTRRSSRMGSGSSGSGRSGNGSSGSGRSGNGSSGSGRPGNGSSGINSSGINSSGINRSGNSRSDRGRSGGAYDGRQNKSPIGKIALVIVLLVAVVFVVRLCSTAMPINVTVNGVNYTLHGAKTVQTAIKESGLPVNPGDLISLKGNILKKSEGHPFAATVNEVETVDPDYRLHDGDQVTIRDGGDIVEDYDAVQNPVPHSGSNYGSGAIGTFEEGSDGVVETRTGLISGEVVERQTVDPEDTVCTWGDPSVGDAKVVALTFDGGPTSEYTAEVLDILAENDAKATFFCLADMIEGDEDADLVHRAHEEGNQVCPQATDELFVAWMDIGEITVEEKMREIDLAYQDIIDALGGEAPSRVVRLPNDEFLGDMVSELQHHADAVIGWTLSTGDWMNSGKDEVYDVLMSVRPGDIVLCHDGEGDHDGTIEALREALPKLKAKGYSFVTIDELMAYDSQS